jgi:16S rRNA (uracil1498-N3)-methyltransferase
MRIPRVYSPQTLSGGSTVRLEEQASTHLGKVLRLQLGDSVRVFDGKGLEFSASISAIHKKNIDIVLADQLHAHSESPLHTHIALGVSKGDKMDLIVQKCTELGVNVIYPVITERCDVKMAADRWQKKVERWQEIAVSACEQSGRNHIPYIADVQTLDSWLNHSPKPLVIFHPDGDTIFNTAPVSNEIYMAFGSEGGFSEREISAARKSGAIICKLGPRILRAETAPISALSIAQFIWGDLTF